MVKGLRMKFEGELTLSQRRQMLLFALYEEGAMVLKKVINGHVVAIVMPGECEVNDADSDAVLGALREALTLGIDSLDRTDGLTSPNVTRGGDA